MTEVAERKPGVEAEREPNFLLAPLERRFLPWLAAMSKQSIGPVNPETRRGTAAAVPLPNPSVLDRYPSGITEIVRREKFASQVFTFDR